MELCVFSVKNPQEGLILSLPVPTHQLRQLMRDVVLRSGFEDVHQNNGHHITPASLKQYLRIYSKFIDGAKYTPKPVIDVWERGVEKLQSLLDKDAEEPGKMSRFRWGTRTGCHPARQATSEGLQFVADVDVDIGEQISAS